ncbi:MAG: hypothetical protein GEU93_08455 [Propionibacteriales bacterium]|nr:hypothetical protein [Propionibacteriales bacterium]
MAELPTWREAWTAALYGPDGFYRRERPGAHFRTSVHASPLFATAMLALARRHDLTTVVDVGTGRGELLGQLDELAPGELRLVGHDVVPRPSDLPPRIEWVDRLPDRIDGLVVANEWLDDIPCDVVEVDDAGTVRLVHVDPATGEEALGEPFDEPWLNSWWPLAEPGTRAEIGAARDDDWADVVRRVGDGLAVAIDYGHTLDRRPALGSLTAYQHGREVDVIPDGSRDITAHVAVDSLIGTRTTQREALHSLGILSTRPPLDRAHADPAGYVRELNDASAAAELTARGGLGDFIWIMSPHGLDGRAPAAR